MVESSTKSLEGIELAVRAGDTYSEASVRITATRALIDRGEGAAAQAQASALLALGERVSDRYWLVTALGLNSQLACLRGEWSTGRNLSEDALTLAYQDPTISAAAAILEYETGNFSQGEAYLERLLEIMAQGILVPHHLAGDRILGLLAHTTGELDRAAGHFEDSLKFCRKAGYRPELAWTCCDYADSLLERNIPGDREKAMSLLNESLHISTELGMRPLMERVQARIERMGSSPSTAPAYPDGLTHREVEALNLIAQGKTNRGIGEALVISEGTVRRHVNNIYDKIGVANRAEATRYALEKELMASD